MHVITSLAGRVANPRLPAGEVRQGGFGGPDGLAAWLRAERIAAVVDATHPFAARMTAAAAEAAARTGVPLLVLRRPGWRDGPGDRWHGCPRCRRPRPASRPAAGHSSPPGRRSLPASSPRADVWFLARSVDPPEPPIRRDVEVSSTAGRSPWRASAS